MVTNLELTSIKNELQGEWGAFEQSDFEAFRLALIDRVYYCFNNDMKHLMSLLYRVDVAEKDVKMILANKEKLNVNAAQIADLIIFRSLQKKNFKSDTNWQEC